MNYLDFLPRLLFTLMSVAWTRLDAGKNHQHGRFLAVKQHQVLFRKKEEEKPEIHLAQPADLLDMLSINYAVCDGPSGTPSSQRSPPPPL